MFFYAIRNIMSNKSIPLCTFRPIFSGKPSFDIVVWLFEFLDEDNKFFVPINSVSPLPRLFEQEAGWQLKFSVDISDDNQLFVPINSIWIISRFLEHDAWLNIVLHSNFVNKNWHKQNRSFFNSIITNIVTAYYTIILHRTIERPLDSFVLLLYKISSCITTIITTIHSLLRVRVLNSMILKFYRDQGDKNKNIMHLLPSSRI